MKTDVSLGVKWLKILSEDISTQIGTCQNEETLRTLFALHKRVLLAAAPHDFDSYLLYVEWNREPDKKFYPPRRKALKRVVDAMQELADDDSSYRRRQTAMPPPYLPSQNKNPTGAIPMGFIFTNLPTQTNDLNGAAAGAVAIAGCVTFRGENINSALTGQSAAATVHYGVVGTVHRDHGA